MRPYDPVSGRWLTYDSTWNGKDPNYYSFCGGDPINGFDPDGRIASTYYNNGVAGFDNLVNPNKTLQALVNIGASGSSTAFNWAVQNAQSLNGMVAGPYAGFLNSIALNATSTGGNEFMNNLGNDIGANPSAPEAQFTSATTEAGLDVAPMLTGEGEANAATRVGAVAPKIDSLAGNLAQLELDFGEGGLSSSVKSFDISEAAGTTTPPTQVPYGGGLSTWAQTLRYSTGNFNPGGNVAVFQYMDEAGETQYAMGYAQLFVGHSETIVGNGLLDLGVQSSQVTGIYTEFAPCSDCASYLEQAFPNVPVSYSFTFDAAGKAAKAATFANY